VTALSSRDLAYLESRRRARARRAFKLRLIVGAFFVVVTMTTIIGASTL